METGDKASNCTFFLLAPKIASILVWGMKFNFRCRFFIFSVFLIVFLWNLLTYFWTGLFYINIFKHKLTTQLLDSSKTINIRHEFEDNLYIYRAYRVRDDEIRITIVKSYLSK